MCRTQLGGTAPALHTEGWPVHPCPFLSFVVVAEKIRGNFISIVLNVFSRDC